MIRASSRGGDRTQPADQRGQIHVDFVVGIVLFLVALTFVVAAIPQLLAPYEDQATPVVADRVAASLGDSLLVGDNDPGMLDDKSGGCVEAFFKGTGTNCTEFDPNDYPNEDLRPVELSGVDSMYRINVSLRAADINDDGRREVVCLIDGDIVDCPSPNHEDELKIGPKVPKEHRAISLDRRVVLYDEKPFTLEVMVW